MKVSSLRTLEQKISRGVLAITVVNIVLIILLLSIVRPALIGGLTEDYLNQLGEYISSDIIYTVLVQDDVTTKEYIDRIRLFPWVQHIELMEPDGQMIYSVGSSDLLSTKADFLGDTAILRQTVSSHLFRPLYFTNDESVSERVGLLHISIDERSVGTRVNQAFFLVIFVLMLGSLGLWYLMRFLSLRATKNIRLLNKQINTIGASSAVAERIDLVPDTVEVENVQVGINSLLTRISDYHRYLEIRVNERTVELANALESSNRSEAFRRSLIMNLSHDLKTPLTANIGYLDYAMDMIEEGELDAEKLSSVLAKSKRSAVLLSDEIRTLLQYSSSSDGTDPIVLETFDVTELVNECITSSSQLAASSSNEVVYTHNGSHDIHTSRRLIRYILDNLLTNAHKACRHGRVTIGTCVTDEGDLHFLVRDTGVGIPSEERERIFESHFQSSGRTHAGPRGMGIGLSLASFWVDQLGGGISVESELGQFTIFSVRVKGGHLSSSTKSPDAMLR